MITVSAFAWVPPVIQGLVRDLRIRWALEEAGLPYETRLLKLGRQKAAAYRALQPFGQVPAYEEDGLVMFESGAVVLHIAEGCEALMPKDPAGRAHTQTWMFAALNTVEPRIQHLRELGLFHADQDWAKAGRPAATEAVRTRLADLAAVLDGRDYLVDRFTAADLLMTTVLRMLRETDLLAQIPALDAYVRRCEGRPAFNKALADQTAPYVENAPAG